MFHRELHPLAVLHALLQREMTYDLTGGPRDKRPVAEKIMLELTAAGFCGWKGQPWGAISVESTVKFLCRNGDTSVGILSMPQLLDALFTERS